MNILFFCWEYPPNGSGIGRYIVEMSSALDAAGHTVTVLTSRVDNFPEEQCDNGVRILRMFEKRALREKGVAQLALAVARDCRADWIEVADHWGEGATLLKHSKRSPVVVKMHYNDVLKVPRYAQAWYPWQKRMIDLACLRQWRSLQAERYSLAHADVLLAPCNRILDEAERQGISLAEKRVVVPNPIKSREWENDESATPVILLVGRLDVGKGLPYLRELLEKLVPHFPDLKLEIAGGDNYARGLGSVKRWFENQLGPMRKHVVFLGVLGSEQMDTAYQRAWVVIVPSRWDTFSQVILESMVRQKAIVASHHGGIPEMLRDTSCVSVDPMGGAFADAVAGFLSDPSLRREAGMSGKRKALSEYSPEHVVKSYIMSCENRL